MPLEQTLAARSSEYNALFPALLQEWTTPTNAADAPMIIRRSSRAGQAVRGSVAQDAWTALDDRSERGKLIMDPAENVLRADKFLKITQAWGLIKEEADELKVAWR